MNRALKGMGSELQRGTDGCDREEIQRMSEAGHGRTGKRGRRTRGDGGGSVTRPVVVRSEVSMK